MANSKITAEGDRQNNPQTKATRGKEGQSYRHHPRKGSKGEAMHRTSHRQAQAGKQQGCSETGTARPMEPKLAIVPPPIQPGTNAVATRRTSTDAREDRCVAAAFPNRFSDSERKVAVLLEISSTIGEWREDARGLDRALLNKLIDGKPLTEDQENEIVEWWDWVPSMEHSMWWWRELAWEALKELGTKGRSESDIDRRLSEIAMLEEALYSALCQAQRQHFKEDAAGMCVSCSEGETRELARRYGQYVRHIDALLLEAFPDLSRALLLNPFPEWGKTSRKLEWVA